MRIIKGWGTDRHNEIRLEKLCPDSVPYELLSEEWAIKNHSQSLDKLNSRGGMGVHEIICNIEKLRYGAVKEDEDAIYRLIKHLDGFNLQSRKV